VRPTKVSDQSFSCPSEFEPCAGAVFVHSLSSSAPPHYRLATTAHTLSVDVRYLNQKRIQRLAELSILDSPIVLRIVYDNVLYHTLKEGQGRAHQVRRKSSKKAQPKPGRPSWYPIHGPMSLSCTPAEDACWLSVILLPTSWPHTRFHFLCVGER